MDVQAVLDTLGIPDTVERVVLVNRRYAAPDVMLSPGDTLANFPPMTGG
jgi:molybdopterin converting factor small subunit